MSKTNFRHEARQALDRARAQLATGQAEHLKYAALELRMAMEALTYDRAEAYAAELPPSEYDMWQPKKLLQQLLDIDPHADKDSTISYGIEEEYGAPPAIMNALGSEKVLNLATLKKHYDALGSHLHMPTIKQLSQGKGPDTAKLAKRCGEIADFIADVLASSVFNSTLGIFAQMPCDKCDATIRKRMPSGVQSVEARCFECPASYTLEGGADGQVTWKPQQHELRCQLPGCDTPAVIWHHELEPGRCWTCSKCSSRNLICLGVVLESSATGPESKLAGEAAAGPAPYHPGSPTP